MKRKAPEKGSHAGSGYLHWGLGAVPHPTPALCPQLGHWGLAFSSGHAREGGFSPSPEREGLERCLLFACLFIEELGCVVEDSASPHPSKMGPIPPLLRMWSSLFCLPMARSLALPSLAWGVRCNLKTLLYLDLISNMTALPTPTLCSQGNSSRLQEKRERGRSHPPALRTPFLAAAGENTTSASNCIASDSHQHIVI